MNELEKISNEALIKELNKRIREGKMKTGEKEQKTFKLERSDYHQLKTIDEWKKYDIAEPLTWTLTFMDPSKKYTYSDIAKEFVFRERWARENKVYPYDKASMKEK